MGSPLESCIVVTSGSPHRILALACSVAPHGDDDQLLPRSFVGRTIAEAIAIGQAKAAIKGVTLAAREIADRTEGRTAQDVRLQVGRLFERMTSEELEVYARDGTLPDWVQTAGITDGVSGAEENPEEDFDS